jgi:hypothetical protein
MENRSLIDKVKEFMKKIEEDDPAPVPLEEAEAGDNVKMELDLGLYSVSDVSKLKYDSIGTLIPELLDAEDAPPAPMIEDLGNKTSL